MLTCMIWWVFLLLVGIGFMPLTMIFFNNFKDRGWLFSKVLGFGVSGFLTWVLVCCKIAPFTAITCTIVTVLCILLNLLCLRYNQSAGKVAEWFNKETIQLIALEEVLFLIIFLAWTYLAGFHPAAYGTEKFMDYGFMASMARSTTLPAQDLWHAGSKMNYYYGGQYYAVFFTKLTGTKVAETYNVMRTMVAAFAFCLPFSIINQIWQDRMKAVQKGKTRQGILAGLLSGAAVSLCGNMHYVIIGKIYPVLQKLGIMPHDDYSYWFPNSTRYIGHYPEVSDRTIHEYPCYSFVLGDLHAHVVNIMYVLTVVGILYAWVKSTKKKSVEIKQKGGWKQLIDPQIVILGFFIGIFHWTNYWDFLIYFVVSGAMIFYRMILQNKRKWGTIIGNTLLQCLAVLVIGTIVALPFTLQFKSMVSGVALVKNHSIFYQWMILWGLPLVLSLLFIGGLAVLYFQERKTRLTKYSLFEHVNRYDMFIAILSVCAIGLIVIPEIVYVRDIYEENSARANTMFKLTYQAFIMFGMSMSYILFRLLTKAKKAVRAVGVIGLVCLLGTLGYFGNAVSAWFSGFNHISEYQGVDATQYLAENFPEDVEAIRWLNENVGGMPVVLEANGDSYSDYERVSAMTGLPTILGWYVHEWLWREDTAEINQRAADIETIYTAEDETEVTTLLDEYHVSYVYVGNLEREKFPELNEELIRGLGTVVFEDGGTYIVEINQ